MYCEMEIVRAWEEAGVKIPPPYSRTIKVLMAYGVSYRQGEVEFTAAFPAWFELDLNLPPKAALPSGQLARPREFAVFAWADCAVGTTVADHSFGTATGHY